MRPPTLILTHEQAVKKYLYGNKTEYLEIGSTPTDEDCTQAGADITDQFLECRAFINQICRQMPPPAGVTFFIVKNTHEAGIYHTVGISYELPEDGEDRNPESLIYATEIEVYPFPNWDEKALRELKMNGYGLIDKTKARRIA
jgi:hypothetical protein